MYICHFDLEKGHDGAVIARLTSNQKNLGSNPGQSWRY